MKLDNKLFSADTEDIVLATLLRNPDLIHSTNGLRSFMFSSTPNVLLYEEMENLLSTKQLLPEPSIIISSLDSKNATDSVGGRRRLESLVTKETNVDAFSEFVDIVMKSWKARTLLSHVSGVRKEGLSALNIDDVIRNTRAGLDNLMQSGNSMSAFHIKDAVIDTYNEIAARIENPGIRGITWGVPSIDGITGGKSPGDLWVIGGRPGAGKSAVVCNSVYHDGLAGVPSLLIEREMRTQELMERLICIDTGIPNTNIRLGLINKDQIVMIRDSLEKLKKMPIYLDTNYRASDPYYVESVVNKFHNTHGIQNVYLDYIQLLAERDDTQTQEIGKLTRLFKIMSNELGICSILLSQLNRNVEFREDKRPMLSDLKQSGSLEEDTDFVIGLYRDEYYNKETKAKGLMEYLVLKHRNGQTGVITVKFDGATSKISEA